MNKTFMITLAGMAAGGLTSAAVQANAKNPEKHMNVLFVMSDDMRPEMGCYGVEAVRTPAFDEFSKSAVVFEKAYCNAPVSGASRASLLTGVFPHYPDRFVDFSAWASKDCPWAIPVFGWFTQHGYYTVSNGKIAHHIEDHAEDWSESPWRLHPDGYDVYWAEYNKWELWLNSESAKHINPRTLRGPFYESAEVPDTAYDDGHVLMKTIQDLARLKESGKPFFLACGFWKPHLPFCAPKKYWDLYDEDEIPLAGNRYRPENLPEEVKNSSEINAYALVSKPSDEAFLRKVKHGYYACVSYVDALFGQLMDALDELGLKDNTIVIFLGDHGWDLGEHGFVGKHNLMDCTTRVPLIIRVPGIKPSHTSSLAELVDLYPTLCELCGLPEPEGQLDGRSLVPILKNSNAEVNKNVYIQWKGGDDLITEECNYAQWDKSGHKMLFDHQSDPNENVNVAAQPSYRKIVRKLGGTIRRIKKKLFVQSKANNDSTGT